MSSIVKMLTDKIYEKASKQANAVETVGDAVFNALQALGIEASAGDSYVYVGFTGDFSLFKRVWALLRSHGWTPDKKVTETKFSDFCTFWGSPDGEKQKLFFNYTSSVCFRKKVGTRMVEEIIYEIECV